MPSAKPAMGGTAYCVAPFIPTKRQGSHTAKCMPQKPLLGSLVPVASPKQTRSHESQPSMTSQPPTGDNEFPKTTTSPESETAKPEAVTPLTPVKQRAADDDNDDDDGDDGENADTAPQRKRYSLRTRLREETEAPFRKARMFVYGGAAASAGVGAFISTLRVIAAFVGTKGVQPLSETIPNAAIDIGVIGVCAFLLQREMKAGERRLERMSRGARIARLRVEDIATRQAIALKDLRGRKRLVVVAGTASQVATVLSDAQPLREEIEKSSLMLVPCIMHSKDSGDVGSDVGSDGNDGQRDLSVTGFGWRYLPYANEEWNSWLQTEREVMKQRLRDRDEVIVIVIRLDGKVGARSIGAPVWRRLLDEVAKLPPKDQYGKP